MIWLLVPIVSSEISLGENIMVTMVGKKFPGGGRAEHQRLFWTSWLHTPRQHKVVTFSSYMSLATQWNTSALQNYGRYYLKKERL